MNHFSYLQWINLELLDKNIPTASLPLFKKEWPEVQTNKKKLSLFMAALLIINYLFFKFTYYYQIM
jgi:hypothetical protein